jgi:predicted alpha/beta-fold hydrolase
MRRRSVPVSCEVGQASGATGNGSSFPTGPAGAPLVVVLHGLEGSARSKYALQSYRELAGQGLAAVGLNFRSCSGELNRLPRLYHSGDTGDMRHVIAALAARFPGRTIGALGFSLGGNVLLKYLGEVCESVVSAAVAISVPFDLAAGADVIERGLARGYRQYLVRRLQRKVQAKRELLDGEVDLERILRARTFREFDDAGTAPLHGFANADDYYARSSSKRFLEAITVPTLLISAYDDPFLPASALREVASAADGSRLETKFTPRGGHVGFVTGSPWAPRFWAEQTAANYLAERLGESSETAETRR